MQVLQRVATDDRQLILADMEVGDHGRAGQERAEAEGVLATATDHDVVTGLFEQQVVAVRADQNIVVAEPTMFWKLLITSPAASPPGCCRVRKVDHDRPMTSNRPAC